MLARTGGCATIQVRLWNAVWRNGRPRFVPGPPVRALGFRGRDLRHADGTWFSLDETRAELERIRAEYAARRDRRAGGERLPPVRHKPAFTVRQLFDLWFETPRFQGELEEEGRRRRKPLSPATVRDYKSKADWLCAFAADVAGSPPAAISAIVAQGIFDRIEEQAGLHMARGVTAVASSCWSWARRRGKAGVTQNPWLDLERPMPVPRLVVYEDFEIAALVASADRADHPDGLGALPMIGDAILLGLFTGQRQGDRLALTDAGRDDKGRRLFRQSKTGAVVAVPETPQLRDRLAAAVARRKIVRLHGQHVIVDERPPEIRKDGRPRERSAGRGGPLAGDAYRKLFAAVRARAAAHCPSVAGKTDQDLRDTAVTWLARAGCTPPEIAAITGHSLVTIHSVLKHYLVLHPEMADAAIGKLVAWMEEHKIAV